MSETIDSVIADSPPNDGREWNCQCARCGSSTDFEDCWDCGCEGYHELYDMDPLWYEPDDTEKCQTCSGHGSWGVCLSPAEWCEANPMPGRENVKRGQIEWFCVERNPRTAGVNR